MGQESMTMCPSDRYICGVTTRYQEFKGDEVHLDDSALNGITIHCCDGYQEEYPLVVPVSQGFEGNTYNQFICEGNSFGNKFICGMKTRNHAPPQNDNTALNGLAVQCCDKRNWSLTDSHIVIEGDFGDWQDDFYKCPLDYFMCGLKVREQPDLAGNGDNTATNGIKAMCCAF